MAQVEFNVPGPGTYLIEADPSLPPLSQPGTAADVLTGEQFYDEEGNAITGTMPSNPAEAVVIPGGGSYTIPQGYHTGQGTVTSSGSVLPTLTDPADAGEIVSGKQAIDQNGAVLTGTMPSNPAISETLEAGESYQVPAGYTPGGTVQAASLSSQTPGTATQDDIIQGQTAWVNGVQITGALEPGSDTSDATATAADILEGETAYVATGKVSGTMPNNGAVQETLQAGGQYTIPAGYHNGQGKVTAESLEDQTAGTATAPDILNGKTAYVNGTQVTGSMPDNGAVTKEMTAGETYTIPAGYHNGSGTVTAPTVASETPGTAVAGDIRQGKTAWVDGEQLTGTVPDVEAATPTISFSPAGLITAETQQEAGYVAQDTKAASQQLQTQGAQTITPGTTAQTIQAGVYLTGAQTVQGDANLVPDNIKENVSIFGVTGAYAGQQASFSVPLTVTVDSGATVTAVNGDTTLTATSVNGQANFILPNGGSWTVSAKIENSESNSVIVEVQGNYGAVLRFPTGELNYYGIITPLSVARSYPASATVGGYALFAGGRIATSGASISSVVDTYDNFLAHSTTSSLSTSRYRIGSTTIGDYALFVGGYVASQVPNVDSYDNSLTHVTQSSLPTAMYSLEGATVGEYALFAGGFPTSSQINYAYNESLTRTTFASLSQEKYGIAGASILNYALFGGGMYYVTSRWVESDTVDSYNESLTRGTVMTLSEARRELSATTVGDYVLFAGGYAGGYSSTVDAYDTSLTRTTPTPLSFTDSDIGATQNNGYAIFANGSNVNAYDNFLTRTIPQGLSQERDHLGATTVGNYSLFAGGELRRGSSTDFYSVVDVYDVT